MRRQRHRISDAVYIWNSEHRLTRIEQNGHPVTDYLYNAFGERIRKVRYAGNQRRVTYYFCDPEKLSAEA